MKKLTVKRFDGVVADPVFSSIREFGLGSEVGAGGFGTVYCSQYANGARLPYPLAVKVFSGSAEQISYHNAVSISRFAGDTRNKSKKVPSGLRTIPLVCFQGYIDGKKVLGYATQFLASPPNYSLDDILLDPDLSATYLQLGLDRRLQYCLQLVQALSFLHNWCYLHSDLNPSNIFLNPSANEGLSLIDLDGGILSTSGDAKAVTIGKPDWAAPEVLRVLASGIEQEKIRHSIHTENWSIAIGVCILIFCLHPLFFLKAQSPMVLSEYLSRFRWPFVSPDFKYFEERNKRQYEVFRRIVLQPEMRSLSRLIGETINEGFAVPRKRVGLWRWESELKKILASQKGKVGCSNQPANVNDRDKGSQRQSALQRFLKRQFG